MRQTVVIFDKLELEHMFDKQSGGHPLILFNNILKYCSKMCHQSLTMVECIL